MTESNLDKFLETVLVAFDARFAKLDSKIEAMSLHAVPKFQSSSDDSARGGGEGADFF